MMSIPGDFMAIREESGYDLNMEGETHLAANDAWLDKMLKLAERTTGSDLPAGSPSALEKRESRTVSASPNPVADDVSGRSEALTAGR